MRIQSQGQTLRVSGVKDLGAANFAEVRDQVRAAFAPGCKDILFELAQTEFLDSCGLGCLVALHKTAAGRGGSLRLLNPPPQVQQILQLTRMDRVFEVVKA